MKAAEPVSTAPTGQPRPLAQIEPYGIERRREVARRDPGGDRRVQQPGAIHVQAQPMPRGNLGNGADRRAQPHAAAAEVGRLFDDDQARARLVAAVRPHRALRLFGGEYPAVAVDRPDQGTGQGAGAAAFVVQYVRRPVGDDLVARPAVHEDGDLVAHRAGGQEHRGLLAQQGRDGLAQLIDGWVLAALFVADRRRRHDTAHGRRRLRLRIAVEIDTNVVHAGLPWLFGPDLTANRRPRPGWDSIFSPILPIVEGQRQATKTL